jgi:hypothetical protein
LFGLHGLAYLSHSTAPINITIEQLFRC